MRLNIHLKILSIVSQKKHTLNKLKIIIINRKLRSEKPSNPISLKPITVNI